ncbi:DUF167 domain-containing protein [Candidatus Saccharibacteria bacterium]|nr:DUF167 domain-containing protein [Candidatus Saccharibacteria bacterium]
MDILVKPGISQEKVVVNDDGSLTVYLRAKAHDGEANKALIKLLSKHFGVAKSRIEILQGQNSRKKVIEVI